MTDGSGDLGRSKTLIMKLLLFDLRYLLCYLDSQPMCALTWTFGSKLDSYVCELRCDIE